MAIGMERDPENLSKLTKQFENDIKNHNLDSIIKDAWSLNGKDMQLASPGRITEQLQDVKKVLQADGFIKDAPGNSDGNKAIIEPGTNNEVGRFVRDENGNEQLVINSSPFAAKEKEARDDGSPIANAQAKLEEATKTDPLMQDVGKSINDYHQEGNSPNVDEISKLVLYGAVLGNNDILKDADKLLESSKDLKGLPEETYPIVPLYNRTTDFLKKQGVKLGEEESKVFEAWAHTHKGLRGMH